jgi:hypothetical protein
MHNPTMHAVKRTRNGTRVPDSVATLVKIGEDIERRWSAPSSPDTPTGVHVKSARLLH